MYLTDFYCLCVISLAEDYEWWLLLIRLDHGIFMHMLTADSANACLCHRKTVLTNYTLNLGSSPPDQQAKPGP
jgi:hypothetical protein